MAAALVAVVEEYLRRLEAGDPARLIELFTPDGEVRSPFLGRVPAAAFFPKLTASSTRSVITPHDILVSARGDRRVCGYFRYDWTLNDGTTVSFECADIFDFDPSEDRIARMTILYDTHPIRQRVGDKYA
jgi:ketosteroid isomerase-like protein